MPAQEPVEHWQGELDLDAREQPWKEAFAMAGDNANKEDIVVATAEEGSVGAA